MEVYQVRICIRVEAEAGEVVAVVGVAGRRLGQEIGCEPLETEDTGHSGTSRQRGGDGERGMPRGFAVNTPLDRHGR